MVVWQSAGQDGDGNGVYARSYSATGAALGDEFRAHHLTTGDQSMPAIAANWDGDFVVTWNDDSEIAARRYSTAGMPLTDEFRVNTTTANNQQGPSAAVDADGDFVVAWYSDSQDGSSNGVYTQRFARTVAVEAVRPIGAAVPVAPGGVVVVPALQLVVTFSGPLSTDGPGRVNDPDQWQLSRYGAAVAGAVTDVTFGLNAATGQYDATLTFGSPLTDARYTLSALPTILDPDGRPLDGNFDGAPGGAFVISFDDKPVPARGPETRANTHTTNAQNRPTVATDAAGNYVVSWQGTGQDDIQGVYAQRYNAAGASLGAEFRVNVVTAGAQSQPVVAMNEAGDFVVAWTSNGQDGSGYGIYARAYFAPGAPQGGEFRVNSVTTGTQTSPTVGMDAAGDIVFAWSSNGQDGSGDGVYARRYSTFGPLDSEFRVNQFSIGDQGSPSVALEADGDFVIAWTSTGQDGSDNGIYARRFSAAGVALFNEFRVNFTTVGSQSSPAVAEDVHGNFVVVWQSNGQDGDGTGVYLRRFTTAGLPNGPEFRVNTVTANQQSSPAIAIDNARDLVVAWESGGLTGISQDGSSYGIYARRLSAGGAPLGAEFRVNTVTTNGQRFPAAAMNAIGDFVVAWASQGQDGSLYGIYGQRYAANLTPTTNGLPNLTIPLTPPTNINLTAGFDDIEDGGAGLIYTLVGNSNPALFSTLPIIGSTLTLNPAGPIGATLLTVRGTDSGGAFIETSFTVTVTASPPPRVTQTQINGGTSQRSRVTDLTVIFSAQVTFATTPTAAFTLVRNADGVTVAFTATANLIGGSPSSRSMTSAAPPRSSARSPTVATLLPPCKARSALAAWHSMATATAAAVTISLSAIRRACSASTAT